ncbi:hypothetical protein AAMO2058_000027900 [Amorphochlora amoebiformis]
MVNNLPTIVTMILLRTAISSVVKPGTSIRDIRKLAFLARPRQIKSKLFGSISGMEANRRGSGQAESAERYAMIQGASRGIGLEMTRQLLEKGYKVLATCRSPASASNLQSLSEKFPGSLVVSRLDVKDSQSISDSAARVEEEFGGVLDVLINSAGILQDSNHKPERQLSAIDRDWMLHSHEVNAVGPLLVVQAFHPFLKRAKGSARPRAVIANISARVGSISDNKMGGWYSYRMSKASLNMATRCMALELKRHGVCAISLHPGTVDTDFTKEYQKNVKPEKLFPVDRAARQLLEIVDTVKVSDTGKFYAWDKEVIPF